MPAPPQRFVIIASQRTGSNMLVSALNSHPEIACHGELFRRNKNEIKGAIKVIAQLDQRYHDEDYQQDNWRNYIDAVVAASGEAGFVGFKLMVNQAPHVLSALIPDSEYMKILLRRENVLAVYSSNKIARETGQGWAGPNARSTRVKFDPREFETYRKRYEDRYQSVQNKLRQQDQSFLSIAYREICHHDGIKKVISFIGADPSLNWSVKTQKRNASYLLDRFTNGDKVKKHLAKIGREDWLVENIGA